MNRLTFRIHVMRFRSINIYSGIAVFNCRYSSSMKTLSNKFMHLTNYSVNKKNVDYQNNTDDTVCQGHKWLVLLLSLVCLNTQVVGSLTVISLFKYTSGLFSNYH